jgi:hypothetical protein
MVLMSLVNSPIGQCPLRWNSPRGGPLKLAVMFGFFLSLDNEPQAPSFPGTARAARPYVSMVV